MACAGGGALVAVGSVELSGRVVARALWWWGQRLSGWEIPPLVY